MKNIEPKFFEIFLEYFKGREDTIACQGESFYYPISCNLNSAILLNHFEGIRTIGVYLLTKSSQCNFVCIDIDIPKSNLAQVDFKDSTIKFEYLSTSLISLIDILTSDFKFSHNNLLLEDTGGRGYHVWIFFTSPVDGYKAIALGNILKNKHRLANEFFPKQPDLTDKRKYGNLIKLPLGEHKSYGQRSRFFSLDNLKIHLIDDLKDNFLHLANIEKVVSSDFDDLIEENKSFALTESIGVLNETIEFDERIMFKNDLPRLFANCHALNRLKDKALLGQKLSNSEAFHLSNILLSIEDTKSSLHRIFQDSYGEEYSPDLANSKLDNIFPFKPSSCKSLHKNGICLSYCKRELEYVNEDPILRNTNPLSLWLEQATKIQSDKKERNLIEEISNVENIKIAYSRLKEYHSNQEGLFFDQFDFSFFELNFDENIQLISIALTNSIKIPYNKYEIIEVPKKVDEDDNMKFRYMSYSSVFDQIVIQSVFNIISSLIEENFQDSSYGYRLNTKEKKSNKIFEDWKEKYPQFRSNILNKLREPEVKYYLCCDIKGFYDNINKLTLIAKIRRIIQDETVFSILKNYIEIYSFSGNNTLGLPQGPAYARALANLYLNDFDLEMSSRSKYYFRYVDDIFILFENKETAEETLLLITQKLANLGLELSTDKEKEAVISNSHDEKILIEKIDSLQYGVFEEFKFLTFLDKHKIKQFYNTVTQKNIPADDSNEINKMLPSLFYFYSRDLNEDIESENEILSIIEELAIKKRFFPKKFNIIFPRIIDIYLKCRRDFFPFYASLHESHKIFFLLGLYDKFQVHPETYQGYLVRILNSSLFSHDKYLKGFALAISQRNSAILKIEFNISDIITEITAIENNDFIGNKLFSQIDYFELNPIDQEKLLMFFKPTSSYLLKKKFLSGLVEIKKFKEIDTELFKTILHENIFLLHAECCRIISLFVSKNSLFDSLINFIVSQKSIYKIFVIDMLGSYIFNKYKFSSNIALDNLRVLYENVSDLEIKVRVLEIIARIKNEFITDIPSPTFGYKIIDSYNECHYYQSLSEKIDFIEIIPFHKFKFDTFDGFHRVKKILNLLAEYKILPKNETDFKTYNESVLISYSHANQDIFIRPNVFSWKNDEDCYNALMLMNNIYKKAYKYFELLNKFPVINFNNVVIVSRDYDINFTKVGLGLVDRYFVKNCNIDNSNSNEISKNLYLFIYELFFPDKSEFDNFEKASKVGVSLFLWYILKRLNSRRISVDRLNYLVQEIIKIGYNSQLGISHLYFSEQLRADLFKNSNKSTNWQSITKSNLNLFASFAIMYKKVDFLILQYFPYHSFSFDVPRSLHYLSRQVININFNLPRVLPTLIGSYSVKTFEVLNYFTVLCVEFLSLAKIILSERVELSYLSAGINSISFKDSSLSILTDEIFNLNKLIKIYNSKDNDIFNESVSYSLKELSIICVLKMTNQFEFFNRIEIAAKDNLTFKSLDNILYTFLNKVPKIELVVLSIVTEINFGFSKNFEFDQGSVIDLKSLNDEILDVLKYTKSIRKTYSTKRFVKSGFGLRKFNRHLIIKRFVKQNIEVSLNASKSIPFTNRAPSDSAKFSYDRFKTQIVNIVIPNDRIIVLIENLGKGKIFGIKVPKLYSGKYLLLIDTGALIVIYLLQMFLTTLYDSKPEDTNNIHSTLWVFRQILNIPLGFFIVKIFITDLTYWFKGYAKFIELFKSKK